MTNSEMSAPTTRVVLQVTIYYLALVGGGLLLWRFLPRQSAFAPASLDALFGGTLTGSARVSSTLPLDELTLAFTVGIAMTAAILLSLPVAWIYLLTRSKRGYQQSVVQLLIILPLVVAGIVTLVKYSLTLAFSLAGIVAAVRFRNSLDDSKDAVYVFLATAIGLSAAVNLPVALVISVLFNVTVLMLWYTDFGNAPIELDGRIADKRLRRAKQLARTGTFVARIDQEVFKNMTKEQLEGVAERAWRRAHASDDDDDGAPSGVESLLRLRTADVENLRRCVEPRLKDYTRAWRFGTVTMKDGVQVVDYFVQLKKRTPPDELLSLVRAAASSTLIDAEIT